MLERIAHFRHMYGPEYGPNRPILVIGAIAADEGSAGAELFGIITPNIFCGLLLGGLAVYGLVAGPNRMASAGECAISWWTGFIQLALSTILLYPAVWILTH